MQILSVHTYIHACIYICMHILSIHICIHTYLYAHIKHTCNSCNMAIRDLPDVYAQSSRAAHTCLQGYKYKLLMPYGQGVECLHSPTIFR